MAPTSSPPPLVPATAPSAAELAEVPYASPCPEVCDQRGLELDPGACAPGRSCVFGKHWCREISHALPLMPVIGRCGFEAVPTAAPTLAPSPLLPLVPEYGGAELDNATGYLPPNMCPCVCQQYELAADPGACAPGRSCVFGHHWCRAEGHALPGLELKGSCVNENCGGPLTNTYPLNLCSSPDIAHVNVLAIIGLLVGDLTRKIKQNMPTAAVANDMIARKLAQEGLTDLTVELGEDMAANMEVALDALDATWLVGCWPPQRYALVNGSVKIPLGRLFVLVAGLPITVYFDSFELHFSQLRASIQCRGDLTLSGLGEGTGGGLLRPETLWTRGRFSLGCGMGLSSLDPICQFVRSVGVFAIETLGMLPAIIEKVLSGIPFPVPLGVHCPFSLKNTFIPLRYARQSCCEASFALDSTGCLAGGQFNGARPDFAEKVSGVQCRQTGGIWRATCDTVPGGYDALLGSCREDSAELPMPGLSASARHVWAVAAPCVWLLLWAIRIVVLVLVVYLCHRCGWCPCFKRSPKCQRACDSGAFSGYSSEDDTSSEDDADVEAAE